MIFSVADNLQSSSCVAISLQYQLSRSTRITDTYLDQCMVSHRPQYTSTKAAMIVSNPIQSIPKAIYRHVMHCTIQVCVAKAGTSSTALLSIQPLSSRLPQTSPHDYASSPTYPFPLAMRHYFLHLYYRLSHFLPFLLSRFIHHFALIRTFSHFHSSSIFPYHPLSDTSFNSFSYFPAPTL
ncbi:hypothetical protein BDN70DRAFT_108981 [Pholiota conissans]|uniref:Uncharacterized protein n=1 Tax=Pholiota conissans TaxID=109636 RepID=A0A9P5YZC2_9AGAR|nr:hypothetical protein BDN70DRAFT_108981 [Pholiota conissans]